MIQTQFSQKRKRMLDQKNKLKEEEDGVEREEEVKKKKKNQKKKNDCIDPYVYSYESNIPIHKETIQPYKVKKMKNDEKRDKEEKGRWEADQNQ